MTQGRSKNIFNCTILWRFKFDSWQKDHVEINLVWTDSFRPEVMVFTSSLRVELCALVYNLSILNYSIGTELLSLGDNT